MEGKKNKKKIHDDIDKIKVKGVHTRREAGSDADRAPCDSLCDGTRPCDVCLVVYMGISVRNDEDKAGQIMVVEDDWDGKGVVRRQ